MNTHTEDRELELDLAECCPMREGEVAVQIARIRANTAHLSTLLAGAHSTGGSDDRCDATWQEQVVI